MKLLQTGRNKAKQNRKHVGFHALSYSVIFLICFWSPNPNNCNLLEEKNVTQHTKIQSIEQENLFHERDFFKPHGEKLLYLENPRLVYWHMQKPTQNVRAYSSKIALFLTHFCVGYIFLLVLPEFHWGGCIQLVRCKVEPGLPGEAKIAFSFSLCFHFAWDPGGCVVRDEKKWEG